MNSNESEIMQNDEDFNRFIEDIFDPTFYQAVYTDLSHLEEYEVFNHYRDNGYFENRAPCAALNTIFYREINSVKDEDNIALRYYKSLSKSPEKPSPLFDYDWYSQQAPDVERKDALRHYVKVGRWQGISPHPLFDPKYYINHNALELSEKIDAFSHYMIYGRFENLKTTPNFDPVWYIDRYTDIVASQIDALIHYLVYGHREARVPIESLLQSAGLLSEFTLSNNTRDPLTRLIVSRMTRPDSTLESIAGFTAVNDKLNNKLSAIPLVSIIIANKNGAHHLEDCLKSVRAQTYSNFEIIFVDDGSTDDSIKLARIYGVDRIIVMNKSGGFTGSNNAGQQVARGELICLLNNDTKAEPTWLETMVDRMLSDQEIGAVASRIRFWEKFVRTTIISAKPFQMQLASLDEQLLYKKYFVRWGSMVGGVLRSGAYGTREHRIEVDLPAESATLKLELEGEQLESATILINSTAQLDFFNKGMGNRISCVLPEKSRAGSLVKKFHIINNAGGIGDENGMPTDRGFGDVDSIKYWDPREVDYFCGCSVLIRKTALLGKKLFIEELFAYFEDSELSHRISKSGYKIFYEPNSIVYHKHSSTTKEGSVFWRKQVSRNEALFKYFRNFDKEGVEVASGRLNADISHLNHLHHWYSTSDSANDNEKAYSKFIPSMISDIKSISASYHRGDIPEKVPNQFGIFNPYWKTMGGGEAHALNIAEIIGQHGNVDLISTSDFDLDTVASYFGIRNDRFSKRIVERMVPEVTADYDVFINSCFASSLKPEAKKSFYIVSFPHRNPPRGFNEWYKFLPNSNYTAGWMERWWGKCISHVVYPSVSSDFYVGGDPSFLENKVECILSVGRFVSSGHIKNQLLIAKAYRALCMRADHYGRWKLLLIGSINDADYVQLVRDELRGLNADVVINASYDQVVEAYRTSQIYVHASGLDSQDAERPELQEHFGMAVAQAACSGCYPVVYNSAGPAEIVDAIGFGEKYDSLDDMVDKLAGFIDKSIEIGSPISDSDVKAAFNKLGSSAFTNKVSEVLEI